MRQPIAWLLSVLLALTPLVPLQAAMIGTDRIINPDNRELASDNLQQLLDQQATQQQLLAWGVSPDMVRARIDSLTSAELARINQAVNDLHAGGDSVLGVLLVIFIVFVITDVIGATDIFPFIHPVK
jgi:hypothetical protein